MPDNDIPWQEGTWTHPPHDVVVEDRHLVVTAIEGSDAWRHTAYDFVHDSEHALLAPLMIGEAMEVSFRAPWRGQFDQAGLFVRAGAEHWVKAGVEHADGHLGLGAVVTAVRSDWSIGFVDEWRDADITVRVSRWSDAVIVRARAGAEEWRLVRVAPFASAGAVAAGPFLAAPTRRGLAVRFTRWARGTADAALH
ncbi:DUF1349 domain-containing protein [Microbacterium sp.]|uniref:DUF1349 domain-containing protein n=1 Tax=Microbacterium sp. TaxID=51671 RepID=UPI002810F622|nr:DUF1349 domain-containing protein [Microbacterium sp.]